MKTTIHPPLSNVQSELLKLFSTDVPEKDLLELKKIMAQYLMDRARDHADAAWEKNGYTDEKLMEMLSKK